MNQKLTLIASILRQPRYAIIAVLSSIGFGILHYFLSMSLLQEHILTVATAMPVYLGVSLSLSALVAALAGINIALIVYKIKGSREGLKKSGSSTAASSALAAFTPGCPACTTPLAVILGTVGGLAALPFQGLELKLISVAALTFSMYWILRGLQKSSCCTTSSSNVSEIKIEKPEGCCCHKEESTEINSDTIQKP